MSDILRELDEIVKRRKAEREEGSYTAYLYDEGLDKVLKKLGEETTETIIAAKNLDVCQNSGLDQDGSRKALEGESGDLLYHLVVMLDMLGVEIDDVEELLRERMKKTKNLKQGR